MTYFSPVSPYALGMGRKCPRCGQGNLFSGYLRLNGRCAACGLDYSKADAGDGPAVFVIFLVGFVGVAAAFIMRFTFYASFAASFFVSATLSVALIAFLLPRLKATLIAIQYAKNAEEGRVH